MLDHSISQVEKEARLETERVVRAREKAERTGRISPQQAVAISRMEREVENVARLTESYSLEVYYRDSKGRFTTKSTDVVAHVYRDLKTGRFQRVKKSEKEDRST
jgi:hypothetical protein